MSSQQNSKWTTTQFANKYWCADCKMFVQSNRISRDHHESSWKHKNNVQRKLNQAHRDAASIQRQEALVQRELAAMARLEERAMASSASLNAAAAHPIPTAGKPHNKAAPQLVHEPVPHKKALVSAHDHAQAQHQIAPMAVPEPQRPFVAPRADAPVVTAVDHMRSLPVDSNLVDANLDTVAVDAATINGADSSGGNGGWVRVSVKVIEEEQEPASDQEPESKADTQKSLGKRTRPGNQQNEDDDEDELTTEGVGTERGAWRPVEKTHAQIVSLQDPAAEQNILLQNPLLAADGEQPPSASSAFNRPAKFKSRGSKAVRTKPSALDPDE